MQKFGKDQGGFGWLVIFLVIGIGAFMLWGMASINWKGILALFAAGIIAMAFAGVVFFKANWNFVMLACIVSLAIVFIIEVTFPVLVGGLMVLLAMWNFKVLSKKPILFMGLVGIGLVVMLLAYKFVLLPMGLF